MLVFERYAATGETNTGYFSKARASDQFVVSALVNDEILLDKNRPHFDAMLDHLLHRTEGMCLLPIFMYDVFDQIGDWEESSKSLGEEIPVCFTSVRDISMFRLAMSDFVTQIGTYVRDDNMVSMDRFVPITSTDEILAVKPNAVLDTFF